MLHMYQHEYLEKGVPQYSRFERIQETQKSLLSLQKCLRFFIKFSMLPIIEGPKETPHAPFVLCRPSFAITAWLRNLPKFPNFMN